MDIDLLHEMCKEDTRLSFEEFKVSLSVNLFAFNDNVKQDMQSQLLQGLCKRTVKYFILNYRLSEIQINYLMKVVEYYKSIVLSVSNSYFEKKYRLN